MPSLCPRYTCTRKNSMSADTDIVCPPSRSSNLARRKNRPLPLQIIPELSENEPDVDVSPIHLPAAVRPTQPSSQQSALKTSRVTLSAYTLPVDDELFMSSDEAPRSPVPSTSSSTSDGASSEESEDVPTTPRISDDEDGHDLVLPTSRVCPQHISIRPRYMTKMRSSICQEDDDTHDDFEKEEEENAMSFPVTEEGPECSTEEAEQDFYIHAFEDFISLSPVVPSTTSPARRDSLTLTGEAFPTIVDVPEPNPQGCSRHSPPVTPPVSCLPLTSISPLVHTCAREDSRPFPRVAVPMDLVFPEGNSDIPSRGPGVIKQGYDAEEGATIFPRFSFAYTASTSVRVLPPEIPEIPLSGTYAEQTLPRSSTDSVSLHSSTHSISSFLSSGFSDTPFSPLSLSMSPSPESELESTQRLRGRWSSNTLDSFAVRPPRPPTLLSPLKSVFGSRARRALLPPKNAPPQTGPQLVKNKHGFPATQSPLRALGKHFRQKGSRSSTSSAGTSPSEGDSREGSPVI